MIEADITIKQGQGAKKRRWWEKGQQAQASSKGGELGAEEGGARGRGAGGEGVVVRGAGWEKLTPAG